MDNNNQNRNNGKKPGGPGIWVMVIVLCITLAVVSMMNSALKKSQSQEVSYDEFVRMIEDGEVEAVRESGSRLVIVPKSSSTQYSRLIQYYTVRVQDLKLTDRLLESGVRFEGEDTSASSSIINFIVGWVLPVGADDRTAVYDVQPYGRRRRHHGRWKEQRQGLRPEGDRRDLCRRGR